jgi:hypothetical protein
LQDLSFDFNDPKFEFAGLRFGIQVHTFENVYGLDPTRCAVDSSHDSLEVKSKGLSWAGGQGSAEGSVRLSAKMVDRRLSFRVEASAGKTIRSLKLYFEGVPDGEIVNLRESPRIQIPPTGLSLRYPDGWRGPYTPLIVLKTATGELIFFRSMATEVRDTRFAFVRSSAGLRVELIYEELATKMSASIKVPGWEVGYADSLEEILEEQRLWLENSLGLATWESRPDVPSWAKEVSLVAAVHCQHWTGYVFNDYERVLKTTEWLAKRIEPRRLLVYLPGWEGRYYWQYGDYRPDPRLGGEEAFKRLTDGCRQLGVKLMPMFGINHANRGMDNFEQWGAPALVNSAGGFAGGTSVDWDSSRHHDHGWGAILNPGAPTWQNRLVGQILGLVDKYGFDGVFLDISATWANDPRYSVLRGVVEIARRLREGNSELLVAGEGWYDGVGLATPLMQAGHSDGVHHWHDAPYPPLFDTYNRSFGHLCLGDPAEGSTGAHELGFNSERRVPFRKGIIPTVTITGDTLIKAEREVLAIVDDANRYGERFLGAEQAVK